MKQTAKYSGAKARLTFPHQDQEELYAELNRLGWYWNSKIKQWERDDTPARSATNLVKIRVWAASDKVKQAADLFTEASLEMGLRLVERSEPYQCRPPQQNESRIYLTFEDEQ